MRVLVVTPWFPSRMHTGSGIFNLRDAEMIAAGRDVRVLHLIRPDWYLEAEEAGTDLSVRRVPFSATRPRTWRGARSAIRGELTRADVLHTMAFPALLPFWGLRVRLPWVHSEHWSGLAKPVTGVKGALKRLVFRRLRRPDRVVAVSASLARSIRRWCRAEPRVIENAVPMPPVGRHSRPAAAGAAERLIAVGGLTPHKGPGIAVDTLAELVRRGVDAELRWVGQGPERGAVDAAVAEAGLQSRVHLLGQLERAELEAELLAAHVFVLPTAGETFGIALAEALACGLPVVASGTGGHTGLLEEFAAARLAERAAPDLADAVQELLRADSAEQREATAAQARERFSPERRSEAYAAVYAEAREQAGAAADSGVR